MGRSSTLRKGIEMMNMHCVTAGYRAQEAAELRKRIPNEEYAEDLFRRLIDTINKVPAGALTLNTINANESFARAFFAQGVDGALAHVSWLISSLRNQPKNSINGEMLEVAQKVADTLQLEW